MMLIPIIELCRYCPGMVTALGVSVGLTAPAIMSKGTIAAEGTVGPRPDDAREDRRVGHHRAGLRLGRLRLHEVDRPTRRDEYLLNGNKTFITNGPYADTIVFICKLDESNGA